MSPSFFSEGLSALIKQAEGRGLHGVKICKRAPFITHLLFVDDCFLFFRSSLNQCAILKNILSIYELASSQALNLHKSKLFFSRNVKQEDKLVILQFLQVIEAHVVGKYLKVPPIVEISRKNNIQLYQGENVKVSQLLERQSFIHGGLNNPS